MFEWDDARALAAQFNDHRTVYSIIAINAIQERINPNLMRLKAVSDCTTPLRKGECQYLMFEFTDTYNSSCVLSVFIKTDDDQSIAASIGTSFFLSSLIIGPDCADDDLRHYVDSVISPREAYLKGLMYAQQHPA